MNLRGIVAVAGKPGLWRALAQNKTGFILESLDEHKTKLVANLSTAKIAALEEITIFGDYEDIKLPDIFERMKSAKTVADPKSDGRVMRELFREVAPDHDEEKVYTSDMKKIITWFNILKDLPEFNEQPEEVAAEEPVKEPEPVKAAEESAEPQKPKGKKKQPQSSEKK